MVDLGWLLLLMFEISERGLCPLHIYTLSTTTSPSAISRGCLDRSALVF
jgi:hypothetical protein